MTIFYFIGRSEKDLLTAPFFYDSEIKDEAITDLESYKDIKMKLFKVEIEECK